MPRLARRGQGETFGGVDVERDLARTIAHRQ
jgi:hypothetical protein